MRQIFLKSLTLFNNYSLSVLLLREMSSAVLSPREAGKFISEHSQDIKICVSGVKETAKKLFSMVKSRETVLDADRWLLHSLNPKTQDEAAVNWVFVTDLLNFSFWSEDETTKYTVRYGGQEWTGYWSLCAAINRALDEGISLTDPKVYSSITREQLEHVFRSDSECPIPMFNERLTSLHQAGKILLQSYGGSFVNMIKASNNSAVALLQLIVNTFVTFRDEAEYRGQKVALYKRAQILVADIWACCGGRGYGMFTDIDEMTAFADYRIPQALVWFGVLQYSNSLKELLKSNHMFNNGDRQEVEIRGCTIWSIELIVEEVKALMAADRDIPPGTRMNSIILDHFMWDYRRENDEQLKDIPFHKTRCIYY